MKPNVTNLWPEDNHIISLTSLRKNIAQHMQTLGLLYNYYLLFALYLVSCLSEWNAGYT